MHIPPPEEDCKLAYCKYLFTELFDMNEKDRAKFFNDFWRLAGQSFYDMLFVEEHTFKEWSILSYWEFVCQMTEYLHQPHFGDCTKQACSCDRCGAEAYFPNEA